MAQPNWIQEKFKSPTPGEEPLFSMQAPMTPMALSLPAMPAIGAKEKKRGEQKVTGKQEAKSSVERNLYADPEAFIERGETAGELPFLADQRAGIQDAEDLFNMMGKTPVSDHNWLVNPLIALTKAETGKDLSGGFRPSPGYAGRNQDLVAAKDDLQKRRNELSKTQLEAMKAMKEGKESNSTVNQLSQLLAMQSGMLAGQGKQGGSLAQDAVDKVFAKEYVDFVARGGYAEVEKNLATMKNVVGKLETEKGLTGGMTGMTPKFVRNFTNAESADVQDTLEGIVQSNLRLILGAQFTENEAKRLIERAYNPKLDQKYNAGRVQLLHDQIQAAAQAKAAASRYYEQYGTLRGYAGTKRISIGDKTYSLDPSEAAAAPAPQAPQAPQAPAAAANQGGGKPGKVLLVSPDGRKGYVPEAQVEAALSQGYKRG